MRTLILGRAPTATQMLEATLQYGDMVRIVRKDDRYANGVDRDGWVKCMNDTIGKTGTVRHTVKEPGGWAFLVESPLAGSWYYTAAALERVDP